MQAQLLEAILVSIKKATPPIRALSASQESFLVNSSFNLNPTKKKFIFPSSHGKLLHQPQEFR